MMHWFYNTMAALKSKAPNGNSQSSPLTNLFTSHTLGNQTAKMMAAAKKQQQHSKYKEINECEKNASFSMTHK